MIGAPQPSVDRFRASWDRLARPEHDSRMLVALSGGPDSTALLLLAHAAFGDRCYAATVDHGLRPESAAEAAHAASICSRLSVSHATLSAAPIAGGNLQANARAVRYRLLAEHSEAIGAHWIATAHHADDQLETMLMRLNRGSGVAGLAAIRAVEGRVVRPLLGWRRAELAAIVAAADIHPVNDPSNRDDRFDRARLRKRLGDIDWLDPLAASRSAAALQDAEAALAWAADRLDPERIRRTPQAAVLDARDLPAELRRRLVIRCLLHVDATASPRGEALTRIIAQLEADERAMLGAVLVTPAGANWTFGKAPARRSG